MIKKIFKTTLAAVFSVMLVSTAIAKEGAFNMHAFEKAQAKGEMIVVDVFKKGCGTCAKQKPILNLAKEIYPDAKFVKVNFKKDKEAVKHFKAVKQSTIIVYKGKEEVARSLGETDKSELIAMISKGFESE